MPSAEDLDRFKLNQNLWGLVVGLGALGSAEYFKLNTLYWFAVIIAGLMSLSVTITTFAYTVNYCKKKWAS